MDKVTTIQVFVKTREKLDKYQKSKKLRTRDDAINDLLDEIKRLNSLINK